MGKLHHFIRMEQTGEVKNGKPVIRFVHFAGMNCSPKIVGPCATEQEAWDKLAEMMESGKITEVKDERSFK